MPNYTRQYLSARADELGFVRDTLEKVYRLRDILEYLNRTPLLRERLALKGGTAINLTIFNLPRLSVDIDLDYARPDPLAEMQAGRTASAAATRKLARADAYKLAILGAGLQGRRHLEAIRLVRDLREVTVWDIRPEAADRYAKEMGEKTGLPVRACSTANEAARAADIICTVTPSREPVLAVRDVKPGAHINAVGSSTPDARELSSNLVAAGRLFVDWKPATLVESGDYLLALREGAITESHILGDVGQVLSGALPGRTNDADITIFKSLGQAVEDLMAADYVAEAQKQRTISRD